MLDRRNQHLTHITDLSNGINLEWYGHDPQAPQPVDDGGLSAVTVEDVDSPLSLEQEQRLLAVDPLQDSSDFGVDIFVRACEIVIADLQ